jgi:hypothetical protein
MRGGRATAWLDPSGRKPLSELAPIITVLKHVDNVLIGGINRKLSRPRMRTFFSSAHYWARELAAMGREVVLTPQAYIKPGACPRA